MNEERIEVYTDGSCWKNPGGVGGWGVLIAYKGKYKALFGGEPSTTNNRMELTAAIKALQALNRPCRITLYTDSQYVQKGITQWIRKWKRRGWLVEGGNSVKNVDLWRILDEEAQRHDIQWIWVRGHAGHQGNEIADRLANKGASSVAGRLSHK